MRKLLIVISFLVSITAIRCAWCEDNLLAVDVIDNKQKVIEQTEKALPKDENTNYAEPIKEESRSIDNSEQDLEKIKAFHELFDNKQKELEIIRLDLEKSNLLLKKKEAEKEIYQIEKVLPQGRKEEASGAIQGVKEPFVDSSDMKIQFLLISDDLRQGQISLKGSTYSFMEGDSIASRLTVERIEPTGVTFKQQDGSVLRLNFIN